MRRVPLNFFQRPQGHVSLADNQLLALLLMVGGATGISRAQSQTEAARIQNNANDSGHNRLTGAAP